MSKRKTKRILKNTSSNNIKRPVTLDATSICSAAVGKITFETPINRRSGDGCE